MSQPRFDPSQSVKFDFGRGHVSLAGGDARLLVPLDGLADLCRSAGEDATKDFARRIGTEAGMRTASRLADGPRDASIETVVEHLGGDLALLGLGSLSVESWGPSLVLTVTGSHLGASGDLLLASVLEGAIQRVMARDVAVVPLAREDDRSRLLVVSPSTGAQVRRMLSSGTTWSDVLARLAEGVAS